MRDTFLALRFFLDIFQKLMRSSFLVQGYRDGAFHMHYALSMILGHFFNSKSLNLILKNFLAAKGWLCERVADLRTDLLGRGVQRRRFICIMRFP